jgi:hypothetical protein
MRRREWAGSGFRKEGWMYCCQPCAEETGCSCYEAARLGPREKSRKSAVPLVTPRGGWRA